MYKIIGADQKEYGPITADQLRQWISEGRVNAQTRVLAEGATEWKTMAELAEFATILPRPAPPLPGMTMPPAPPAGGTSQMAIWALITGLMSVLCCCYILAPVAVVLGAVALTQLKHNPGQRGAGFAIAGIVLGVIGLLIMVTCLVAFSLNPGLFPKFPNLPQ